MGKVRFGIVGIGNMGGSHADRIFNAKDELFELTAVCDVNPKRFDALQARLPDAKLNFYENYEDMYKSGDIDAVIVATPHFLHPEMCISALNHGIHTICEKPEGVYTKQVKELNEVASKSDKLFTVMFNQRTDAVYRKMHEMISDGAVGEIKRITWLITNWYRAQSYYDSSAWRATWKGEGGGVLFNQCPHQLDLIQWVTGLKPSKVRAFCHFGKWHDIEVEDDVTAYLEYPNGATGVFVTSTADWPGANRLEISGTKGTLVCENGKVMYTKLAMDEREFNSTWTGGFGRPDSETSEVETDGNSPQHMGIISNFAKAILGIEPLYVDGREGINGVQLMDAMLLSTWLDKTVDLPIDDDLYLEELNKRIATSKEKVVEDVIRNVDMSKTFNKA